MTTPSPSFDQLTAVAPGPGESANTATLDLFHNDEGIAFVDMYVAGHRETHKVSSEAFRQRLLLRALARYGKAPTAAELKSQVEQARAKAVHPGSPVRKVYVRAGCADGHVYIDLADADWNVVEVGPRGWRVIQDPPVRFIRQPGMLPMPTPQAGGSIETLKALVNVHDDDDFVLLVAWVLNALRNEAQHPVLVLNGAEGTAKSTLVKILRALIDPGTVPFSGLPRSERELAVLLGQRYLQGFDNVGDLSRTMSDAFCRQATGGDARPVIINGIGDVVKRPDLADRCLFIACDAIPDELRRSEGALWADFEIARPQILGLLLNALSHGLKRLPETQPQRLPRMADFALWATACEGALWPKGTFTKAYDNNIAEAVENVIGADLVASAVRQLAARQREWTGTASELDGNLRAITGILETTPQGWPSDPARLAKRLRELAAALNKVGIAVSFTKGGHNRTRLIAISVRTGSPDQSKHDEAASAAATTPSISPSAPSAGAPNETENDVEVVPVSTTATSDLQNEATAPPVAHGRLPGIADGADGSQRPDKSMELVAYASSGKGDVPVYRHRKPGTGKANTAGGDVGAGE